MGYYLANPIKVPSEAELIRCLASPLPDVIRAATEALWEHWLDEAGPAAREEIDRGIAAMRDGELDAAAAIFEGLRTQHPAWAEPVNKSATVRYLQGRPEESMALCCEAVKLKPDHFGAWKGMALCAVQTGEWLLAREAILQSLRLQPDSAPNLQLLALVDSRLANC